MTTRVPNNMLNDGSALVATSVSGTTTAAVQTSALGSGTPDGTKFLRDDRTWQTVAGGVTTFNTRSGAVTLTSADVSSVHASGSQIFTASGTFTVPNGVNEVFVTVAGGGGAGGSAVGGITTSSTGGGGGGGGVAYKRITGLTPGGTVSVTVGGAGGTSSFGAYCSATGGANGAGGNGTNGAGGAGGSGSGGDVNVTGGDGGDSAWTNWNPSQVWSGSGGAPLVSRVELGMITDSSTYWYTPTPKPVRWAYGASGAGLSPASGNANGNASTGYGCGGGGARRSGTAGTNTGGAGAGGIVIVQY